MNTYKLARKLAVALSFICFFPKLALGQQILINFDDVTTSDVFSLTSYKNLTWTNLAALEPVLYNSGALVPSGYQNGIVSPNYVGATPLGTGASFETAGRFFSLRSMYYTAAWRNGVTVNINGYNGSALLRTMSLTANATSPTLINFNWSNLSKVSISASGGVWAGYGGTDAEYFALDNILISYGPDSAATLIGVQQNASALSGVYNVQAAALQAGLTYDCNTFDKYGLCASVGGRATYGLTAPSGNQQAGLVVVSHKPDAHFRYGGFADQSVATASPNGIKYNNSGPMFGFFGYWNHQKDNMGWGASVTTAFSNSNLTVTRNASLANTEAGSGNTEMQGQAVQAQATYAMQATTRIKAQPYLGLRYYRVATGGYSEGSNADVTSPLTYNAMAQEVFAAVGGLGTSVFLAEKLTGNASVGIQQNLNYKMGNYQGTSSISGLESFSVSMPSNINSMATATAGVTYAIKKNEKLSLNALWQQQAFSATNTITALATYSIGF